MNITIQYYDRQIGPYTTDEVNRRLREGKFKPDALAWQEGTDGWVPLKSIPGIGATSTPVPRVVAMGVKQKFYRNPLLWIGVILAVLLVGDIWIRLHPKSNPHAAVEQLLPAHGEEGHGIPLQPKPAVEKIRPSESARTENPKAIPVNPPKSPPAVKTPNPHTADKIANAVRIRARVLQVTESGLLVLAKEDPPVFGVGNSTGNGGGVFIPSGRSDKNGQGRPREIYGNFFISGHPKEKTLTDDTEIDVDAYQDGIVSFTTAFGGRRTIKNYTVIKAFE